MTEPSTQSHAPSFTIRPIGGAELPFVLDSWCQSFMRSPGQPFGATFKRHVQPTIVELLNRDDVWLLGAFGPGPHGPDTLIGWLAWTPGELPAIHYAFVRGQLRKRGIFNALLKEAMVGRRMLATFRGQLPRYRNRKAPTYDKKVIEALARRGIAVAYVEISTWLERMR
jgi:hypothetical protein